MRLLLLFAGAVIWWLLAGQGSAHADTAKPADPAAGLTQTLTKTVDKTVDKTIDKPVDTVGDAAAKTVDDAGKSAAKAVDSAGQDVANTVATTGGRVADTVEQATAHTPLTPVVHPVAQTVRDTTSAAAHTVRTTTATVSHTVATATHTAAHAVDTTTRTVTRPITAPRPERPVPAPHRSAPTRSTPPTASSVPQPTPRTRDRLHDATSQHRAASVPSLAVAPSAPMPEIDSASAARPASPHTGDVPAHALPTRPLPAPGRPGSPAGLDATGSASSGTGQQTNPTAADLQSRAQTPLPTTLRRSVGDDARGLLTRAGRVTVWPG